MNLLANSFDSTVFLTNTFDKKSQHSEVGCGTC